MIRCRVETGIGPTDYEDGTFLGLTITDEGDTSVVVRLDRHGMYVNLYHPSKVQLEEQYGN
jgi:hypothetical protein